MPAKEIKELRLSGKLDEAYTMAKAELEADLSNIWGKRSLSWVLYSQLDEYATNLESFLVKINEVKELNLPESEEMFFGNISIVIARATRVITHETTIDLHKMHLLFDANIAGRPRCQRGSPSERKSVVCGVQHFFTRKSVTDRQWHEHQI